MNRTAPMTQAPTTQPHRPPTKTMQAISIALVASDGVGIRNFVHGPFLRSALQQGPVQILHMTPADLEPRLRVGELSAATWTRMPTYHERPTAAILRASLANAQVYWLDSYVMKYQMRRPLKGSLKAKTVTHLTRWAGWLAAFPAGIKLLDRLHQRAAQHAPEIDAYKRLFEIDRPSILFCSNQRPVEIVPIVLAARAMGIPTATFIFSWDNLSSKARIAAPFDHYLVWSEHMRDELLKFYPDVRPDQIHIVGTPQFDPYADPKLNVDRSSFCREIGADPDRPLICYSGGDVANAPQDPDHLRILLEHIRTGRIAGRPQVVLRPAPVDPGTRYADLRRDYPELIYCQPEWWNISATNWGNTIPAPADVRFIANLTRHCDLNINLASTMTLDFAIHDRPVVNIAFDTRSPLPYGIPLWDVYQTLDHYRPVLDLGAACIAKSADELADHVNAYLADPQLDREGRARFVELEVGAPIGESSQRIIDVLTRLSV